MLYTTLTPAIAVPEPGYLRSNKFDHQHSNLRGESTVNLRYITYNEILERQMQVRCEAHRARHAFSVTGIRHLVGNTIIALGTHLHGKSETRYEPIVDTATATVAGD